MKGNDNLNPQFQVSGWLTTPLCTGVVAWTINPIRQTF